MINLFKICYKCKKEKSINEFYKHKGMNDGHLNICKECKRKYGRKYSKNNRDKINEYRRNNPKIKLLRKNEHLRNKDRYIERAKERYKKNKKKYI